MEAIGLAASLVGLAGLPGIFISCLECFELIQCGRNLNQDYVILETKFSNQKLRFAKWGEACGFGSPAGYDKRLDEPILQLHVTSTLNCIEVIFRNGKTLKARYGLKPFQGWPDAVPEIEGRPRKLSFSAFVSRVSRRQDISTTRDKLKWAVSDKKKFGELVQHLNDFIGDLERLTQHLGIPDRQRVLVREQIELITDIPTLDNMEASRIGPSDNISDAASERLQRLCGSTQSRGEVSGLSRSDEFESSHQSYTTAPERLTFSESTVSNDDEPQEIDESNLDSSEPNVAQNKRIMADLLGRIPSNTDSLVKPIDTSSVGNLIASVRHDSVVHALSGYPLSIPRQPSVELTTSTSVARAISNTTNTTPVAPEGTYRKRMMLELHRASRISADYVNVQPIGDSLRVFLGSMEGPPGSPYHGGIFHVLFLVPKRYPMEPPHCQFITKIYHPNIDLRGRICLDTLNDHWGPNMTLTGILISIVSLMDDPGIEEPLVPEIAELFLRDKEQYHDNARSYKQQYAMDLLPTVEMVDKCLLDMAQPTISGNSVNRILGGDINPRMPTFTSLFDEVATN